MEAGFRTKVERWNDVEDVPAGSEPCITFRRAEYVSLGTDRQFATRAPVGERSYFLYRQLKFYFIPERTARFV
jgi:hypothetical protein